MQAHATDPSPIPSAPFDDLDLDRPEDEEEWERRVMAMAAARIAAERVRLVAAPTKDDLLEAIRRLPLDERLRLIRQAAHELTPAPGIGSVALSDMERAIAEGGSGRGRS